MSAIEAETRFLGLLIAGPGGYSVEQTFFSRSASGAQDTRP